MQLLTIHRTSNYYQESQQLAITNHVFDASMMTEEPLFGCDPADCPHGIESGQKLNNLHSQLRVYLNGISKPADGVSSGKKIGDEKLDK